MPKKQRAKSGLAGQTTIRILMDYEKLCYDRWLQYCRDHIGEDRSQTVCEMLFARWDAACDMLDSFEAKHDATSTDPQ
jgi:hypothetical protein